MAKRGRPRKSEAVKPSEVMKVPSETRLKRLLREAKSADADKNEAVGRKGGLIASAVEKDGLDKKAWNWSSQLERASPNKGSTTLAHFLHYVRCLGLEEKWAEQLKMFEREETDPALANQPKPGSFAAKVAQAREANGPATRRVTRRERRKPLTPEEVQAAADRAEESAEQVH
jgi:hypothetical protein